MEFVAVSRCCSPGCADADAILHSGARPASAFRILKALSAGGEAIKPPPGRRPPLLEAPFARVGQECPSPVLAPPQQLRQGAPHWLLLTPRNQGSGGLRTQ